MGVVVLNTSDETPLEPPSGPGVALSIGYAPEGTRPHAWMACTYM